MARLDIQLGVGIGQIKLGMHPDDVVEAFAESQICEHWMGGNLNDAILFHGLRLHFDKCSAAGPLADSRLCWIVVHQREDAHLFDRPTSDWTKEGILQRLIEEGYTPQTPENGDVEVPGYVGLSFNKDGRLIWLELD